MSAADDARKLYECLQGVHQLVGLMPRGDLGGPGVDEPGAESVSPSLKQGAGLGETEAPDDLGVGLKLMRVNAAVPHTKNVGVMKLAIACPDDERAR